MTAHTPKKKSLLRIPVSLCAAAGTAFLMMYFMEGPRLGSHYDLLLKYRPPPPVSREILLIETGTEDAPESSISEHIIEPAALATVLLIMTELDGASLIIDAPILGLSSGEGESREEMIRRLNGEFALLGRNIKNLFDAIRVGAVAPEESDRFVEELVDLTDQGKERLISALVRRDEAGMDRLDQAAAVFGNLWRAGNTGRAGILSLSEESPPDRDGKLRRIAPIRSGFPVPESFFRSLFPREGLREEMPLESPVEHIVYSALKGRYQSSDIEYSEDGPLLRGKNPGEEDRIIPLDRGGAILFEAPREGESFRHISRDAFREYDEADRALYRLLKDGAELGIYNSLAPEERPPLVYEHVLSLREDLLQAPAPEKKSAWIAARRDYLAGLENFFTGPGEANLVTMYEELIAGEGREEPGELRLRALRDEVVNTFGELRQQYIKLGEQRDRLALALSASFCILAPPAPVPGTSALLANALLTGRAVTPGTNRHILFWSLVCVFLVCLCTGTMGTILNLCTGIILTALAGAAFSYSFIITGYWIDPLIPMAGAGAGVLSSSCWAFIAKRRYKQWFRDAYRPFMSRSYLRRIVRTGSPLPTQCLSARAAVVAVRNTGLTLLEDQEEPLVSAREALAFREAVSRIFTPSGAVIAGNDGDMVLAVFGSPPERAAARENGKHAGPEAKAAGFVAELLRNPHSKDLAGDLSGADFSEEERKTASWHFGIDAGECAFTWSPQSGYTVFGRPAVRARILSNLTSRYRTRILISSGVNEKVTHLVVRKLGTLKTREGDARESFYELLTEKVRNF
jgi:class 3 adenylate cyclase